MLKMLFKQSAPITQQNVEISEAVLDEDFPENIDIGIQLNKLETHILEMVNAEINLKKTVNNNEENEIVISVIENYKDMKNIIDMISHKLKLMADNQRTNIDESHLCYFDSLYPITKAYYVEFNYKLARLHSAFNMFQEEAKNKLVKVVTIKQQDETEDILKKT